MRLLCLVRYVTFFLLLGFSVLVKSDDVSRHQIQAWIYRELNVLAAEGEPWAQYRFGMLLKNGIGVQ